MQALRLQRKDCGVNTKADFIEKHWIAASLTMAAVWVLEHALRGFLWGAGAMFGALTVWGWMGWAVQP